MSDDPKRPFGPKLIALGVLAITLNLVEMNAFQLNLIKTATKNLYINNFIKYYSLLLRSWLAVFLYIYFSF